MTKSAVLLISDLHLSADAPQTVQLFQRFLAERAPQAEALFILGDLFDAWIGDDNNAEPWPAVRHQLASLTATGTAVFVQHGNRDFLLGDDFCRHTGVQLLAEEAVIDLCGTPTLLMHGDTLCTDDLAYQQARLFLRNPTFINDFLSKSLAERAAIAVEYRQRSGEATSLLASDIMDVNQAAVMAAMRRHGVTRLIHGHTHRQGQHNFELDGQAATRIVLGEWHPDRGMALEVTADNIQTLLLH